MLGGKDKPCDYQSKANMILYDLDYHLRCWDLDRMKTRKGASKGAQMINWSSPLNWPRIEDFMCYGLENIVVLHGMKRWKSVGRKIAMEVALRVFTTWETSSYTRKI